jgi:hypothetical protein
MVEIELPDLQATRKELAAFPGGADFAIAHTLNDVAGSAKAAATSYIFQRYAFDTQGPISRGIKVKPVSKGSEVALVRFQGTRFPVKLFMPTKTDEGIEIMEIRGKRSTVAQAFAAAMQYGFGIFKRLPDADRGPVRSVTGLSVANMAREDKEVLPAISAHVREQLEKRLKFWVGEVRAGNREKYERKGGHGR